MTTNPTLVGALLAAASLLWSILLIIKFGPCLTDIWRRSTGFGRWLFAFGALAATLYGDTKNPAAAPRRTRDAAPQTPPLRSVAHRDPSYFTMPEDAETFAPWNLHGAKSDWTPANGFVAFPNGKLRLTPHDAESELGLDFGDLAAEPGRSHLWWRTEPTGTRVVTWTNLRRTAAPRTAERPRRRRVTAAGNSGEAFRRETERVVKISDAAGVAPAGLEAPPASYVPAEGRFAKRSR